MSRELEEAKNSLDLKKNISTNLNKTPELSCLLALLNSDNLATTPKVSTAAEIFLFTDGDGDDVLERYRVLLC